MAKEGKRYGYSGIAVIGHDTNEKTIFPEDFSIYRGVQIQAKPSRVREEIRKYNGTAISSVASIREDRAQ